MSKLYSSQYNEANLNTNYVKVPYDYEINNRGDIYMVLSLFIGLLGLALLLVGALLPFWNSSDIIWVQWVLIVSGLIIFLLAVMFLIYFSLDKYHKNLMSNFPNNNILYIK